MRHGRPFVRRLIHLSKKVKYLHRKVRLSVSAQKDINWWLHFMQHYHSTSLLYEQEWILSDKLQLWTDAADYGYGCVLKNQYICEKFCNTLAQRRTVCYCSGRSFMGSSPGQKTYNV